MEASPDVRPIAVGESVGRLTGKCICAVVKNEASDLLQPLQLVPAVLVPKRLSMDLERTLRNIG